MQSPKLQSSAQGTIEYLVILAVVVVIGLAVVAISSGFFDNAVIETQGGKQLLGSVSSNIVVREAIVDNEGTALLSLENNTSEELILTKITLDGTETPYNELINSGSNTIFSIPSLSCVCSSGEITKTCTYEIYTTSRYGLEKKEIYEVKLECVSEAVADGEVITQKFNLNIATFGEGIVSSSGLYSNEEIVSITAIPNDGWKFINWETSNGGTFANASLASTTFTMPSNNTTITANFEEKTIEDQYFIFLIRTTSVDQNFNFIIDNALDLNINWGDGLIEIINGSDTRKHKYALAGDYNIMLKGEATRIAFGGGVPGLTPTRLKDIYTPISNGVTGITSAQNMFNLVTVDSFTANNFFDKTSETVTNISGMFTAATNFNQDISNWDTSNVTNMSWMFTQARNFNQNISNWNTSKVTDMHNMFNDANKFNQDISNWDTSNVTNMSYLFFKAKNFNQDITNWNTDKVTNMGNMFNDAISFNQDLSDWNVLTVTNCAGFNYNTSNWILPKPNLPAECLS